MSSPSNAARALSLDDLRLVRAIGSAGSLSGAARALNLDHSSAFRRLAAVEARLGTRLFERARDGYTPTDAGQIAIEAAGPVLDDLENLERRLAGMDHRSSGIVRVTTTDTLVDLLCGVIAELRSTHPEIVIDLVVSNAFLPLRWRDSDIAVRPAAVIPDYLVGRRIATVATAPYCSATYLSRLSEKANGLPLAEHSWIGFDASLSHLASARWIKENIRKENIEFRTDSVLAVAAAARAGLGVAALPCYLGDLDPALERLHPPLPEFAVPLWVVTHPDLRRVARIRTIVTSLAARVGKLRYVIEGTAKG